MKFAEIIKLAGLDPNLFPNASKIPTACFDRKNREVKASEAQSYIKLFQKNKSSEKAFKDLVAKIEESKEIDAISVKIEDSAVLIGLPVAQLPIIFARVEAQFYFD